MGSQRSIQFSLICLINMKESKILLLLSFCWIISFEDIDFANKLHEQKGIEILIFQFSPIKLFSKHLNA